MAVVLKGGHRPADDSDVASDLVPAVCPRCAAAVRGDAPWCSQCYLDLRVPETVEAVPAASTGPPRQFGDEHCWQPDDRHCWPCAGCGTANPLTADDCRSCGLGFLAQVRADEPPLLVLPGLGNVGRLSRGQLAGAACSAAFVLVLLTFLLGVVVT